MATTSKATASTSPRGWRPTLSFLDAGEKTLKNIPRPVRAHSLSDAAAGGVGAAQAHQALTGARSQAPDFNPAVISGPLTLYGAQEINRRLVERLKKAMGGD